MYIKGIFGVLTFDFPNFFLMYENKFLILNKIIFFNVIKQISMFYKKVVHLFFFRLKLRGLGYEIVKSSRYMYRFFFAKNHFYYFHIPVGIFFKCKFRNFFFLSFNKAYLNDIFSNLLKLKKLDFYEKSNSFFVKNRVIYLKKRK